MAPKTNLKTWVVMSVICLGLGSTVVAGDVIYVDDDAVPGGDGATWATAYKYLQDALADANSGGDVNEIRVAQGIYKPDRNSANPYGTGDRTAAFELIKGVTIKGGYAGFGEPDANARNIESYQSILSGDLDGNDISVSDPWDLLFETTRAENSYNVITGSGTNATAVVDGFTITGGNADGPWPEFEFQNGGGMRNGSIDACSSCGGSPTVANCAFSWNSAYDSGGAIANIASSPNIANCAFTHNGAGRGAGIADLTSSSRVTNCTFSRNTAFYGGAMFSMISSSRVSNSMFSSNSALKGGGIDNCCESSPKLMNCTFSGNWAKKGSTLSCSAWPGRPSNDVEMTNCILWDGGDQIYNEDHSMISITYSNVQDAWPGEGNMEVDPCFVSPGCWVDVNDHNVPVEPNEPNAFWIDGDYRLLAGSPCIDTGDNNSLPADTTDLDGDGNTAEPIPFDLDGNPRIVDGDNDGNPVVDMGAYEFFIPPIEVAMKITPQTLNLRSKGRWVKAHCVLPEGFGVGDVDTSTPGRIEQMDIKSEYMNVFVNEDELVEIEIAFDRAAVCEAARLLRFASVAITVKGLLTTGQPFYGTDTIKIINRTWEHLAGFASHWLQEGCSKPDWCGALDINQDSVVNLADFAPFGGW